MKKQEGSETPENISQEARDQITKEFSEYGSWDIIFVGWPDHLSANCVLLGEYRFSFTFSSNGEITGTVSNSDTNKGMQELASGFRLRGYYAHFSPHDNVLHTSFNFEKKSGLDIVGQLKEELPKISLIIGDFV